MLTADQLKQRLLKSGLCDKKSLRGCTERELKRIEKHIGQSLPEKYKQLMAILGKGAGDFMSDLDTYYPSVVTLTDETRQTLADTVELPADAFVFADRYGEQFLFFHLGTGDDPLIYRWHDEAPRRFRKVFKSIWDFIEEELNGHEMQLREDAEE